MCGLPVSASNFPQGKKKKKKRSAFLGPGVLYG